MEASSDKVKEAPNSTTVHRYLQQRQVYGCFGSSKLELEAYLCTQFPGPPSAVDVPFGARTVFILTMNADKCRFAAAHGDHTVRVYCALTGRLLHTRIGHPRSPWCLQFHPTNYDLLASGCLGGDVRVWDLSSGTHSAWQRSQSEVIASLAFHPSEPYLAVACEHDVVFWNWQIGRPVMVWRFSQDHAKVRWVQFSPVGDCLYTGSGNRQVDEQYSVGGTATVSSIGDESENTDLQPMYTYIREEWARIQHQVHQQGSTSALPTREAHTGDPLRLFGGGTGIRERPTDNAMDDEDNSAPIAFITDDPEPEPAPITIDDSVSSTATTRPNMGGVCSACSRPEPTTSVVESAAAMGIPPPDNPNFECLTMFRSRLQASTNEAGGPIRSNKIGRLEQQIYGPYKRPNTPGTSASGLTNSRSSGDLQQAMFPGASAPGGQGPRRLASDPRNQPRPVQVVLSVSPGHDYDGPSPAPGTTSAARLLGGRCSVCGVALFNTASNLPPESLVYSQNTKVPPPVQPHPSRPPSAAASDPIWMALESRCVGQHRDYGVPILDQTVNMTPTVRRLINQTLAGLFFGRGDPAVATNLLDTTYCIRRWELGGLKTIPRSPQGNVIVRSCKLHNDGSVSLSPDSRLLAVFVPAGQFPDETVLSVYSTLPGPGQGRCLYTKKFGPNAISVEFSPLNDMLLVGLASRRIHRVIPHQLQVIGQVYRLNEAGLGEHSMQEVVTLLHPTEASPRSYISINGMIWSRTGGIIYATSNAQIFLVEPSLSHIGPSYLLRTVGTQTHAPLLPGGPSAPATAATVLPPSPVIASTISSSLAASTPSTSRTMTEGRIHYRISFPGSRRPGASSNKTSQFRNGFDSS